MLFFAEIFFSFTSLVFLSFILIWFCFIILLSFLSGILRYKIDLQSIQMMLNEEYYDNEFFDLDDY